MNSDYNDQKNRPTATMLGSRLSSQLRQSSGSDSTAVELVPWRDLFHSLSDSLTVIVTDRLLSNPISHVLNLSLYTSAFKGLLIDTTDLALINSIIFLRLSFFGLFDDGLWLTILNTILALVYTLQPVTFIFEVQPNGRNGWGAKTGYWIFSQWKRHLEKLPVPANLPPD